MVKNSRDTKERIHQAVLYSDLSELKAVLGEAPGFVDARYLYGDTPLLIACKNGDEDIVRFLVEAGADIDAEDSYHRNPLLAAIEHKRINIVRYLLDKGADVHQIANNYHSCIYEVFFQFDGDIRFELAERMLAMGADINAKGNRNILKYACGKFPDAKALQFVLEHGADPSSLGDYEDLTPLMEACRYGNLLGVKLLLDAGAEIDTPLISPNPYSRCRELGLTALMLAVKNEHAWCAELLLSRGANPNIQIGQDGSLAQFSHARELGKTALHFAIERGNESIIQMLLSAGADPSLVDDDAVTPQQLMDERIVEEEGKKDSSDKESARDFSQTMEPLSQGDWDKLIQDHGEFLKNKRPGGRWRMESVSGLMVGKFHCHKTPQDILDLQANLRFANLSKGFPKGGDWSYAEMSGVWAEEADFSGTTLKNSMFANSYLHNAVFDNGDLSLADFFRSDLGGASFRNANLHCANFEDCDLRGADFTGANIDGIKIQGARLDGAIGFFEQLGLSPIL